jgi:hypothetical protein
MVLKFFNFLIICLSLISCSQSMEDFHDEGQGVTRAILKELKKIHTRTELLESRPKLKRLFNDLVDIIIAAQEYHHKHPESEINGPTKDSQIVSDQLRAEMNRIYSTIDGGREIFEKMQENSLHKLGVFEKRMHALDKRDHRE